MKTDGVSMTAYSITARTEEEMKDEEPLRTDRYYKYCPKCDAAYPRGIASDYPVECECGEKFTVPKSGTLVEAK